MHIIPLLQQSGGGYIPILTLGLIFVIFYVFIVGPQKKEQKKTQAMIASAQKGDKIVTIGGIHGVISSVKESTIIVKVDDNCKIEMSRSAIASIILDEKTKLARQQNMPTQSRSFFSFGKKAKDAQQSDSQKPNPPDFSGGTV